MNPLNEIELSDWTIMGQSEGENWLRSGEFFLPLSKIRSIKVRGDVLELQNGSDVTCIKAAIASYSNGLVELYIYLRPNTTSGCRIRLSNVDVTYDATTTALVDEDGVPYQSKESTEPDQATN